MKGLDSNPNIDDNLPSPLVGNVAEPKSSEPKGFESEGSKLEALEAKVDYDTSFANDSLREDAIKTQSPATKLSLITATTFSWASFAYMTYVCEEDSYIQSLVISYAVYFASYYATYRTVRFFEK